MGDDDVLDLAGSVIGDEPDALQGRERRLSVRAYNYWVSLLEGRNYPSVADLKPEALEPFRDASVLLDFSLNAEKPVLRYVGRALREECGLTLSTAYPEDVPGRSLLSRLTDHYLEILANRAPIGFEAEFRNMRGNLAMYRGILLPLSDDGETIDFILGAISWKEAQITMPQQVPPPPDAESEAEPLDLIGPVGADGAAADEDTLLLMPEDSVLQLGDADMPDSGALLLEQPLADEPPVAMPGTSLDDLVAEAREAAAAVQHSEGRSRAALYDALARAYAVQRAANESPASFAELLAESGVAWQERSPCTPTVKLIFGAAYDKTRLAEYAAALSHGLREDVDVEVFRHQLDTVPGGLKALVQAERQARAHARGNQRIDRARRQREALRMASPMLLVPDPGGEEEFVLLVGRRVANGIAVVAVAKEPQPMIDGVLRRLPKA